MLLLTESALLRSRVIYKYALFRFSVLKLLPIKLFIESKVPLNIPNAK